MTNAGELSSSSQQLLAKPTSFAHGAKLISFWGTCAVGFGTFGYFFDQIKPYEYDNKKTVKRSDYLKKKSLDSLKSCYNSLLSCGQSLTGYFGAQFMTNVVRSCSFRPPHSIKFESVNLFMAYVNHCKQSNPYEKVNNVFVSAASSCCMENFFEHGMPDLANLLYMLPVSFKFKIIRFFGGNRISLLPKMGEPFLNGMLSNFDLAEYIVKGWSGKYHVNDKMMISLNWFLLLTSSVALRLYLKQENGILTQKNEISKKIRSFKKDNFAIGLVKMSSYIEEYLEESSITKTLEEFKDDTKLGQNKKYIIKSTNLDSDYFNYKKQGLLNKFECYKEKYKGQLTLEQELQKLEQELPRKLFFGNIIAFITGIFFHAFLNASYYLYTHYQKI